MLQNLKDLWNSLHNRYVQKFQPDDYRLPDEFKKTVTNIDGAIITYSQYSFVVHSTSGNNIYFPNQLWLIAAYFTEFYQALFQYVEYIRSMLHLSDEEIKACKGKPEYTRNLLVNHSVNKDDIDNLTLFLSDYSWWGGGKGAERTDYFYSPILSLGGLVNASQSYVAEMCKYLASHPNAQSLLNSELSKIENLTNAVKSPLLESKNIADFMGKVIVILKQKDSLSRLNSYIHRKSTTIGFLNCNFAKLATAFDANADERRKDDCDKSIVINYHDENYYYYKEQTRGTLNIFAQYVNTAYKDIFVIELGERDYKLYQIGNSIMLTVEDSLKYISYLRALRTKPFLLLAGISGTGKSRIVREFAFKSCPTYLQDKDHTTPGNYCMIEVKPNWHDSSEVLGYYSNISKQYHFTKFVRFLVKAMMYPNVPFFVCLDEMNLAPVEQYFAEFLSILETRKKCGDNIETGTFIDAKYFKNYGLAGCKNNGEVYMKLWETTTDGIETEVKENTSLIDKGLTLPDNVFIIGTVNMDDTTHQFSRKVIDRAMTIEMNGGNLEEMFGHSADLDYTETSNPLSDFQPKYITADEVLNAHSDVADNIMTDLPTKLEEINKCLEGTPFQISYRVLNELCIYLGVLLDDGVAYDEAVAAAVDQITLMKILPRIEGDQDLLGVGEDSKLAQLMKKFDSETASYKKLKEMNDRLEGGFTRFWP